MGLTKEQAVTAATKMMNDGKPDFPAKTGIEPGMVAKLGAAIQEQQIAAVTQVYENIANLDKKQTKGWEPPTPKGGR